MPEANLVENKEAKSLKLECAIGFGGTIPSGFLLHPDGKHTVYPMGSNVIIRTHHTSDQEFLQGHSNVITCLAVSNSGRYIASGQVTHMGFQADIIVWEYATKKLLKRMTLHKVCVVALAFSPNEKYLASLGGQDDNSIIVWDLATGTPICGTTASKDSSGITTCLAYSNQSDLQFVTGGQQVLRIWRMDVEHRKLQCTDCQLGQVKRSINCISVDAVDEFMYCGTTTGDLLQVSWKSNCLKQSGPPKPKDNFSLGIVSILIAPASEGIYVGCGDGTIAHLKASNLSILRRCVVEGSVTSLFSEPTLKTLTASTVKSNIYTIDIRDSASTALLSVQDSTCHYARINDLCFPEESSKIFATASDADIRIWNLENHKELLRIHLPNISCNCLLFKKDGTSLITGWDDGKIRGFGPESGLLQYTITDAHKDGVTALDVCDPSNEAGDFRLVTGGVDGQVRVWKVTREKQSMENAMKEHKETVTCIKLRRNNLECVSSSTDGSCIVWDLTRFLRNQVIFAPSFFKSVLYYPEESQILTCGTGRKVSYWEAFDGTLIREIEASKSDTINGLDITRDGRHFVIGGSDKAVKVYRYEEGSLKYTGVGHSTEITKIRISPDQQRIVSVSNEGAILIWNFPETSGPLLLPPTS